MGSFDIYHVLSGRLVGCEATLIAGVTDAATLAAANLFSVVVFAMLCLSVVAVVAIVVVVVFLMLMMLMLTLRAVNVVFEDLVL